ncbi:MAG: hypothetical protein ISS56_00895 [Anaerolineae bacterium]|nr:hypothetical protein [Anaerolineae bacterium]
MSEWLYSTGSGAGYLPVSPRSKRRKPAQTPAGYPARLPAYPLSEGLTRAARVTNGLDHVLLVEAVRCEGEIREAGVPVPAMESAEIGRPVELELGVRCLADMIVPRKLAVVRHAGKREKISLEVLLGLDELFHFPWVKRLFGVSQRRMFSDLEGA